MEIQEKEIQTEVQLHRRNTKPGKVILILGVAGLILLWIFMTQDGIFGIPDAIGYAVCHRISVRSFFMGERQFPLCARCTGMYLGALCALLLQLIYGRKNGGMPPRKVFIVLGVIALLWLVDGTNSYLHLFPHAPGIYEPNNTLRILTGSGIGMAAAVLLYPAFQQTVWKHWSSEPAVRGLRQLGSMIGLILVVDGLVLLQMPVFLYPAALLSAFGVLVLLSMVYSMLLLMILKLENCFNRNRDLFLPLTAGLGIAILQIIVMDEGRSLLLGGLAVLGK